MYTYQYPILFIFSLNKCQHKELVVQPILLLIIETVMTPRSTCRHPHKESQVAINHFWNHEVKRSNHFPLHRMWYSLQPPDTSYKDARQLFYDPSTLRIYHINRRFHFTKTLHNIFFSSHQSANELGLIGMGWVRSAPVSY